MKAIKRVFTLLIAIILAGCSQTTSSGGIGLDKQTVKNMPQNLNIWCDDVFLDSYGQTDRDELNNWCLYMSNKYGSTISLKTSLDLDVSKYIGDAVFLGKIDGVACLEAATIEPFSLNKNEDGNAIILPLEEYLKDNKVWNSLPEDFRNQFYLDGHIWALPRSTKQTVNVTSIRTDWLKKVGLSVPKTLDELYEAGKAFLQMDVDGDGNNKNNYLLGCPYGFCGDILRAYGLYGGYNYSYNLVDQIYEYPFLKPNAQAALEYLQRMYKEGMIDPNSLLEPDKTQKAMMNGGYGTVQSSPGQAKYGINEVYEPLESLSKDYPTIFSEDDEGYVLTGITKDPYTVVNAFVNIL